MFRILLILCLFLSSPAFAADIADPRAIVLKGDELRESDCLELVRLFKNQTALEQAQHIKVPITVALAQRILILDCPMQFMTAPIVDLIRSDIPEVRDVVSLSLGAAYEHGIRVKRDLDEARHWYRKLAFRLIGVSEKYLDFIRRSIAKINPAYRSMSSKNWTAAFSRGDFASDIFEEELEATQALMNGPASGIVAASEHLYRGTGGFPRDKEVAKKILYDAARDGAPEAQYAFAIALLDRRFSILGQERQYQLVQAETYLMKAIAQHHLPSVVKLAELCEKAGGIMNRLSAYALYNLAAREGAQDVSEHLKRLRKQIPSSMNGELNAREEEVAHGRAPICY